MEPDIGRCMLALGRETAVPVQDQAWKAEAVGPCWVETGCNQAPESRLALSKLDN